MAKILFIGTAEADAAVFRERIDKDLPGLPLFATNDRKEALERAGDAEAIIGHHFQFDQDIVARAPRLRWIQSLTTGTDRILGIPSLPAQVQVTSTRGMHGPQMSELVFLHMLALTRNFPRVLMNQAAGRWERWPQPLLLNKTAVIVGVGAIAETLAPRCKAFGMQVIGVTGTPRPSPGFDRMLGRDQLRHAASLADFLILVVPYSKDTSNLVDRSVLGAMRPDAFLINVARGGVLDEQALTQLLRAGRIAGAALDVFRETPLPASDPLWSEPSVIITPTLGGMSDIYLDQAYPYVLENLRHFVSGHLDQMTNIVDR